MQLTMFCHGANRQGCRPSSAGPRPYAETTTQHRQATTPSRYLAGLWHLVWKPKPASTRHGDPAGKSVRYHDSWMTPEADGVDSRGRHREKSRKGCSIPCYRSKIYRADAHPRPFRTGPTRLPEGSGGCQLERRPAVTPSRRQHSIETGGDGLAQSAQRVSDCVHRANVPRLCTRQREFARRRRPF